jgi:hypothetical protein
MSEKTSRKPQLYVHFWIAEPEVYGRNVIYVELEAANACCESSWASGSGFIRWREGDSIEELWQRLYRKLGELCRPRQVWTDHSAAASRRRGGGDVGR